MSELNDVYVRFPQVMVNIKATPEEKARYKEVNTLRASLRASSRA